MKILANLGDVNPLDHGGFLVSKDEIHIVEPVGRKLKVSQFDNARCYPIEGGGVSDNEYHQYHPAWFSDSLTNVGEAYDHEEIADDLCSEDPVVRASAYRLLVFYHGVANFDSYPITLTRTEVRRRYRL